MVHIDIVEKDLKEEKTEHKEDVKWLETLVEEKDHTIKVLKDDNAQLKSLDDIVETGREIHSNTARCNENIQKEEKLLYMNDITYVWTDSSNKDFENFYLITEAYYSRIVGGVQNRKDFVPYNTTIDINNVLIAYEDSAAVGCAGFKHYSETDVEIKRVWVQPEHRGKHLATKMMEMIEQQAKSKGYKRAMLQTREIMTDAVKLYEKLGYARIDNYPPYNKLDGAVCFAKEL